MVIKKIIVFLLIVLFLAACKNNTGGDSNVSRTHDGEDYKNEQEQSNVTETGQNIGNNTDSTSIDGPPGNPSNN